MTRTVSKVLFIFSALVFLFACAHESGTDVIVPHKETKIKTQTITWFFADHHDTTSQSVVSTIETDFAFNIDGKLIKAGNINFGYDSQNRLAYTESNGDTIYYLWQDDKLKKVYTSMGYYDGGSFKDTTTFFYDDQSMLDYALSTYEKTRTDFKYLNNKISAKYITHKVSGNDRCDSLLYTWADGNLIAIQTCSSFPLSSLFYMREFKYDDKPSWTSLINYPTEYLFIREITQFYGNYPLFYYDIIPWRYNCKNNPVEFTEHTNTQTKVIPFHVTYHESGFPEHIHGNSFKVELEYY